MKTGGYLVISLDFELMWGMFDKVTPASYGANLDGVQCAIPEILALFKAYEIHATWATVGMLMHENLADLQSNVPNETSQPTYPNSNLSSYTHLSSLADSSDYKNEHYFAPELVKQIIDTPHQELASHTFSHYYCLDGRENSEAIFTADCNTMKKTANRFSVTPTSIVFPRNQTTPEALAVCKEVGLTCYRGTEQHWLYTARTEAAQTNPFIRAVRLLDHYLNISGHHTFVVSPNKNAGPTNVPASRFFRPFSKSLQALEPLRLRRIKKAMTYAATHDQVFHLWWHPHNFGINRKENIANLKNILEHYKTLKHAHRMESATMAEMTTRAGE